MSWALKLVNESFMSHGFQKLAEDEQEALAERDLAVRRNVAELDPANEMAVRYFGQEQTDALVRTLWGGDRRIPRPGVS